MTSIFHPRRSLVALLACAALTSCGAWQQNAAFWNSPQGQAMTLQAVQQQQALDQQNYQFEQTRLMRQQELHADLARSMQPVRVQHTGSIDVQHSGTIRIRR
jgi:hypothetical protein